VHSPQVLILDEPASALDPLGVLDVRALLHELRDEGAAILLSSHQLSEVALVSDRIALLHEGRLLRYGRLDDLLGSAEQVEVALHNLATDAGFVAQWGTANGSGAWRIPSSETRRFLEDAWTRGAELVSVTPVRGDLTSLFLEWTKREQRSGEADHR
jgi:ABC-2 type transport system ATP-binding protein